jgi:hypothetical protein
MDGYQCIGGIYCFYFQDRKPQKTKETGYSKKLVTIYETAQRMFAAPKDLETPDHAFPEVRLQQQLRPITKEWFCRFRN